MGAAASDHQSCLSDEARQLYIVILNKGPAPGPDDPRLQQLLDVGLIAPHPDDPAGRWIALDPTLAAERRRLLLLAQAKDAIGRAEAIVERVQDLAIAYQAPVGDITAGGVERIVGIEEINGRISEIIAAATHELLTAQPSGPRAEAMLDISKSRDADALRRGVAMRTIYRSTARADAVTARWTAQMTAAGAHVRTLDSAFERAIIVDRRTAVITDHAPWTGGGPEPVRAIIVHDPAIAHFAASAFMHNWDRGQVWAGVQERPDVEVTELQARIMRKLAAGVLQAALAGELGMSQRSVTHQIALLKRTAGVSTLVELAIWWDRRLRAAHAAGGGLSSVR